MLRNWFVKWSGSRAGGLLTGASASRGPGTAPGFYMCPIVAVHWSKTGRQMGFTQSRLDLGLGVGDGVRILKAADGATPLSRTVGFWG